MNKKILIGSIFVLALILLMPSIPAIQQKTIEDKAYIDFEEKLKDVDFEDIEKLEWIMHPILFIIVQFILNNRINRFIRIWDIAVDTHPELPYIKINHIFLMIYGLWLMDSTMIWWDYWENISDNYGWNWNLTIPQ